MRAIIASRGVTRFFRLTGRAGIFSASGRVYMNSFGVQVSLQEILFFQKHPRPPSK